jgi:hypothetical protein
MPHHTKIDETLAANLVELVLSCIDREYPHSQICWFESDADIQPPRQITPAFYGCLDWHSAVHGHWMLVRLCRYFPAAQFQERIRQALTHSLTPTKIAGEITHLQRQPLFECPYGFAWLLQLAMELRQWNDSQAQVWLSALAPLETLVANNFHRWLHQLAVPNRTGTHQNTAFALGLILDWARSKPDRVIAESIDLHARKFYLLDRHYPIQIEPLAYDFISPSLAAADVLRRILTPSDFAKWLTDFLPQLLTSESAQCWQPISIQNSQDYLQAHFRGLHLSRAWMLEGIISQLSPHDDRLELLNSLAVLHRQHESIDLSSDDGYANSHWLGTFVVYLLTQRGLGISFDS